MTLSERLRKVPMQYRCPHCGHNITAPGTWFQAISHFKCPQCERKLRLTYEQKLALFMRYMPEGTANTQERFQ